MNFFEHQDKAKKHSVRLLLLFGGAVVALIIVLSVAVGFVVTLVDANSALTFQHSLLSDFSLKIIATVAALVVFTVIVGMLVKASELKSGGKAVAAAMGAKLVSTSTNDFYEKRLLNIVEEMAIASGVSVPSVFVLEDGSINAFAAGYGIDDAVIGVTEGTLKYLNRDELQGVVAHEFSHIFHGDMRLNIKLVAWLHGIMLIGHIGRILLRSTSRTRASSSSRKRNDGIAVILMLGLVLTVGGYAGSFFGGIIKAALNRQREYLADASAVQYTRNPDSIAGALKKIGANAQGSSIANANADEFSHIFFSQAVSRGFARLSATHPPLEERILRIQPRWNKIYPPLIPQNEQSPQPQNDTTAYFKKGVATAVSANTVLNKLDEIGKIKQEHLNDAKQMIAAIDTKLNEFAHQPFWARAVVWCLLVSEDKELRQKQLALIPNTIRQTPQFTTIEKAIKAQNVEKTIPLVEICALALKELSPAQYDEFKFIMSKLIKADAKVTFFEWALFTMTVKSVEGVTYQNKSYKLQNVKSEVKILLSMLSHAGQKAKDKADAFNSALKTLGIEAGGIVTQINFQNVEKALVKLLHLNPMEKLQLVRAMIVCVSYNQQINQTELQLLKAISYALDVALPPVTIGDNTSF
jgi:Zn-dependent protease with chaperone function